jgi:hypothetical protein
LQRVIYILLYVALVPLKARRSASDRHVLQCENE